MGVMTGPDIGGVPVGFVWIDSIEGEYPCGTEIVTQIKQTWWLSI